MAEHARETLISTDQRSYIHCLSFDGNPPVNRAWKEAIYQPSIPSTKAQRGSRPCVVGLRRPGDRHTSKTQRSQRPWGPRQQEQERLHSLTWWGFWFEFPPHGSFSDCVVFVSVCLMSAGRKVTPSRSQQVSRSNGGWSVAIANVPTFCLVFSQKASKKDVKLLFIFGWQGHLEKFWWCAPRIPGISRVFQSNRVGGLGTSRSQKRLIDLWRAQTPGTKEKTTTIRNVFSTWFTNVRNRNNVMGENNINNLWYFLIYKYNNLEL